MKKSMFAVVAVVLLVQICFLVLASAEQPFNDHNSASSPGGQESTGATHEAAVEVKRGGPHGGRGGGSVGLHNDWFDHHHHHDHHHHFPFDHDHHYPYDHDHDHHYPYDHDYDHHHGYYPYHHHYSGSNPLFNNVNQYVVMATTTTMTMTMTILLSLL